jgi:ubiquinone/menaquinone biosynthesis C-methylase UbiE
MNFEENERQKMKNINELSQGELRDILASCRNFDEVISNVFHCQNDKRRFFLDNESMDGEIAGEYDKFGKKYWKEKYKMIADEIFNFAPQGQSITEIGCGSGNLIRELAEKFPSAKITGIDISKDMLDLARANLSEIKNISLQELSIYGLNELREKPDIIVFRNTLHRLKDAEKALQIIINYMPKGGKLYLRDVIRNGDWKSFKKRLEQNYPLHNWIKGISSAFTTQELKEILSKLPVNFDFMDKKITDPELKLSKSIDATILIEKL